MIACLALMARIAAGSGSPTAPIGRPAASSGASFGTGRRLPVV